MFILEDVVVLEVAGLTQKVDRPVVLIKIFHSGTENKELATGLTCL